jgi:hypothetical protein
MPAITELERIAAKVTHCDTCGDTWYDSGIGPPICPHCLAHQLATELTEAKRLVHEHRSEFLGAVQRRIIDLGHNVPTWPDYEDDVESAAQLILGLLRQLDDVERLRQRSQNQRRELRRLNKTLRAILDGVRFTKKSRNA